MPSVPYSLRVWFIIHFIVDVIFAIPLLFFPVFMLNLLGFALVEPITARLVGAALLGIGGSSLITQCAGKESFKSLLTLKIIWSLGVIIGLLLSIYERVAPPSTWWFLGLFGLFLGVWVYYYRLRLQ